MKLTRTSTGSKNLTFTNSVLWRAESCGESLCIVSLKKDWEHYYLYMKTWGAGTSTRWFPSLGYYEDIHAVRSAWTIQFDIECDNCAAKKHCYVSHSGGDLVLFILMISLSIVYLH